MRPLANIDEIKERQKTIDFVVFLKNKFMSF